MELNCFLHIFLEVCTSGIGKNIQYFHHQPYQIFITLKIHFQSGEQLFIYAVYDKNIWDESSFWNSGWIIHSTANNLITRKKGGIIMKSWINRWICMLQRNVYQQCNNIVVFDGEYSVTRLWTDIMQNLEVTNKQICWQIKMSTYKHFLDKIWMLKWSL